MTETVEKLSSAWLDKVFSEPQLSQFYKDIINHMKKLIKATQVDLDEMEHTLSGAMDKATVTDITGELEVQRTNIAAMKKRLDEIDKHLHQLVEIILMYHAGETIRNMISSARDNDDGGMTA